MSGDGPTRSYHTLLGPQRADETSRLYPDLVAAGGLSAVLQAKLTAIGSPLCVFDSNQLGVLPFHYARVEWKHRFSQVYAAAEERLFMFDCWERGVALAKGRTPDLGELADAINLWVASECSTSDAAKAFRFILPEPRALDYERGTDVEARWTDYLTQMDAHHAELVAIVAAASRRPELRRLFPFTSLNTLHFSRCTGYPFTRDVPFVRPLPGGQYQVVDPSDVVLGQGDAEMAADLVVRHLPPGCGAAVAATADDLTG